MQAKLPDINNIWIRWRNYGIQCIDQDNYLGAAGAVSEMNSLLTDDYRIEINTKKYNQLREESVKVVCGKCETQFNFVLVKKFDLILPSIVSFIANSKTAKVWNCQKCHITNFFSNTKIIKTEHERPFYLKIIPEHPIKQNFADRIGWHEKWQVWFYNAMEELEHQLGKYRAEWISQEEGGEVIEEGSEHAD